MANDFIALPVPPGNGAGAAVDTSGLGRDKTITVAGTFDGTLTAEFSLSGAAGPWQPIGETLSAPDKQVVPRAAEFMRLFGRGGFAGSPDVTVAGTDDGGSFISITVPASGAGPSADISAIGSFKTALADGDIASGLILEVSDNGTDWNTCFSFGSPGAQDATFTARLARARWSGSGGSATLALGGIDDAVAANAVGSPAQLVVFQEGGGQAGPVIFDTWVQIDTRLNEIRTAFGDVPIDLVFDDSVTSPETIPAGGPFAMINTTWRGLTRPGGFGVAEVEVADGASFTDLRTIESLRITSNALTSPNSDIVDGDIVTIRGDSADVSCAVGAAPFWDASGLSAGELYITSIQQSASLGQNPVGGQPVLGLPVAGTLLLVEVLQDGIWQRNSVSAAAGTVVFYTYEGGAQISRLQQPAVLGTLGQLFAQGPRLVYNPEPGAAALTSATVIQPDTVVRASASGGAFTLTLATLPTATFDATGRFVVIKEVSGSAGLSVAPGGTNTIDGSTTSVAIPGNGWLMLSTDGPSNWNILSLGPSVGSVLVWGSASVGSPADTRFLASGHQLIASLVSDVAFRIAQGGTLRNFRVRHNTAGGNGNSVVYDVRINGAAQGLGLTLATGAVGDASNLTSTFSVVAGDLVEITATKAAAIGGGGAIDVVFNLELV